MNNHWQRLSKSSDFFLYKHFNTYDHCEDDILVMPIEEVTVDGKECMNIASKRLEREEYWYKELACVFPYGLNDNVRKIGNISKRGTDETVVWAIFNKRPRKRRNRPMKRVKQHKLIKMIYSKRLI